MRKILIAEDDKFNALAYRSKFESAGFDVRVAADGNEALKLLESFIPDAIVLDLMMPVKGGVETLSEIKKTPPPLKDIPVIIATNLMSPEEREKCFKMGAVGYFVKSEIKIDDLVAQIEKVLRK